MQNVLITGGAGFIGSHFVRRLLAAADVGKITVLDALTYAGSLKNLAHALSDVAFVEGTLDDTALIDSLVRQHDTIVHFAAESHVTRSLGDAGNFVRTNVLGTYHLLDAARRFPVDKFVQVSTDEVYGPIRTGAATEDSPLRPTVPYAASKAAADMIALSYHHTYGVPVCVTRSSNIYGPGQHPEKLVPRFIARLLSGRKVTLHGRGEHVRNWLHVEDNCQGIERVMRRGLPGEVYNVGGGTDQSNKELTELILRTCGAGWDQVQYGADRACNDMRYAVDYSKLAGDLGYQPRWTLKDGIEQTVSWYREHPERWQLPEPATAGAGAGVVGGHDGR